MVTIKLKGVNPVKDRRTGEIRYYAWRGKGAPRLKGVPGSPEFTASYHEAIASRREPDAGRMKGLVAHYRASPAFTGLAPTTQKIWNRWLDRISDHFGELRLAQFDRPEKIRPVIRRWRNTWADRPRSADYAIQVLSRVLAHAVDLDRIGSNPCEGMKSLYANDRAEIIWTDEDLAALKAVASPAVWQAVTLAVHTGLRAGDLTRLAWSHIGTDHISIPTSKSRGGRAAFVPLYGALREALEAIPKRSTVVLTNEKGRPWRDGVNGTSFRKARDEALPGRDLHCHDLRGTAATRFHMAGLSNREIAEIMAWDEDQVDRIIRRYVSRSAVAASIIRRLNEA